MAGSFVLDLTRMCQKADLDIKTAARKLAFEAFRRVVLKTPVDTGRARANWSVTIGSASSTSDMSATDKDGAATVAKIATATQSWTGQGSIFLCNSLPYIAPLEFGHSKKAPNGMVRVTVEEMQRWANK